MKLGVYSISVPEWPPEKVIEAVKAHGYEGVEGVMGYPDARYAEGREWHIDTRTVEQDVDRVGALCREGGALDPLGRHARFANGRGQCAKTIGSLGAA